MIQQSQEHITFAIFPDPKRALQVERAIDERLDEDVEVDVITDSTELSPGLIPLRMTMARTGVLAGVAATAALSLFAIAALVWAGLGPLGHHPVAPYVTTGIAVLLATGLGALGGGLALTTQVSATLERLRKLLDYGHTVLLVESRANVDELLRRWGAVQVGVLV